MHKLLGKDLISISLLAHDEIDFILLETDRMKKEPRPGELLKGKTLAMIFEKPSTRTRVSFEAGMYQLGGIGMYFSSNDLQMGRGETIKDTAQVLSRYVDGIMARTYLYQTIIQLARYATIPVINGLTDFDHPCQALSDLYTIREKKGYLRGLTLAYIGDGNNVLHSLIQGCAKTGMHISYATPRRYEPEKTVLAEARETSGLTGTKIQAMKNPADAVKDADVIYTDVWVSMGREKIRANALKLLKNIS